jgi:NAD(P)-dependent dehydrogenase (short-subunit alcohol dehydrogenase family)
MPDHDFDPILITGCSTGIGRATAERLARSGYTVYATARRRDSIADLKSIGCRLLELDVTDEGSMSAAVQAVEADHGAVGALVNNAGYSQSGAVETVPMALVRRQFETNVFGLLRMTQLVLPKMRERHRGRIINISSIPGGGVYHATKYAVEALSEALRFEVRGFGVDIVLIEPGLIRTSFGDAAVGALEEAETDGPYGEFNAAVAKATKDAYEKKGPVSMLGGGPESVAKAIERALSARRPRLRYTVTPSAKLAIANHALLPDGAWQAMMRTQFPQPK